MSDHPRYRELVVPAHAAGLRLDRFLALRFRDRSRSELVRGIKAGQVTDADGRVLRASTTLRGDETLHVFLDGIAPSEGPPPFPEILHEDDRLVAVNKPPGLMAHPAGTRFVYALVGLARERWPDARMDLVHRLDMDTSGVILLTKDMDANRWLKTRLRRGQATKTYTAIVKGVPTWDAQTIDAPIGPGDGPIRIQMAIREDGLASRTDAVVEARNPDAGLARVRCTLHTGRTHQIRLHLAHVGSPLLGDRMYGVPPEVFLSILDHGLTDETLAQAGAPRHALHASTIEIEHPSGGYLEIRAPLPADMTSWWSAPEQLPWDPSSV